LKHLSEIPKRTCHFQYYLREVRELSGMIKTTDSLRFSPYNREMVEWIRHFVTNKFLEHF